MSERSPLRVAIVVGEESGDQLGARLMAAMKRLSQRPVEFFGVGGDRMAAEGAPSLFSLHDIAVMGFGPVVKRLPLIQLRTAETAGAVIAGRPDVLVIIDSPDFTHRVARDVRAALPNLPIIDYVCPSVWAWRPNRARRMAAYVDHVLTLLPFEPAVLTRLKGPEATYVGHPLIDRPEQLTAVPGERLPLGETEFPTLLVLEGSKVMFYGPVLPGGHLGIDSILPAGHVAALAWTGGHGEDSSMSALVGLMLQATGFISTEAGERAVQPGSALTGIVLSFSLLPALLMLLSLPTLFKYDLTETRLNDLRGAHDPATAS